MVFEEAWLGCCVVCLVVFCCAFSGIFCDALLVDLYGPLRRQMIKEMTAEIIMEDKTDTETITPIAVLSMVYCVMDCEIVSDVKFTYPEASHPVIKLHKDWVH